MIRFNLLSYCFLYAPLAFVYPFTSNFRDIGVFPVFHNAQLIHIPMLVELASSNRMFTLSLRQKESFKTLKQLALSIQEKDMHSQMNIGASTVVSEEQVLVYSSFKHCFP
jgi:hypothetical protein